MTDKVTGRPPLGASEEKVFSQMPENDYNP